MRSVQHQRGFVVALSLAAMAFIIGFMYLAISTDVSQQAKTRQAQLQDEWLREARTAMTLWYERNKSSIDANANAITRADAFAGAGLATTHGVQFQSTARLTDGAVQYHMLVLWLPQLGVTGTGFDAAGVFQQGTKNGAPAEIRYALINGRNIELETLRATQNSMRLLVKRLEAWFKIQAQLEPSQGAMVNYFRADACTGNPPENRLGCIDSYTDFDHNRMDDIRAKLGMSVDDARDDWGGTIQFTNLEGMPPPPPYSAGLRANTPWGTPTLTRATITD
ncbi:MAG: hypothetical protein A2286_04035 [Gammaproteobacteria bacterium RIFOXYA12_FULL_61_12]|nr:MAG: hypothetical protein A2514_14455 [Gammaproteobacteria bacterium RIFOXYD12_FULL_61_37]OGT94468.1 MAG: hypothetical protein A2286_04035 [Gammaproteobacteria bacterium RIFOXYA12_FULL_61_12]